MRELTAQEHDALAKIVADPAAWWSNASVSEKIDEEAALSAKLARWSGVYTDTKAERDAVEEAERNKPLTVTQQRRVAYGSIQDQLDMLYWDQVNGTSKWKDHVTKVKTDHPKT
jgi:hypothetical protein